MLAQPKWLSRNAWQVVLLFVLWHKIITAEKLFWNNSFCKTTNFTRNSLKRPFFPEDPERTKSPENSKKQFSGQYFRNSFVSEANEEALEGDILKGEPHSYLCSESSQKSLMVDALFVAAWVRPGSFANSLALKTRRANESLRSQCALPTFFRFGKANLANRGRTPTQTCLQITGRQKGGFVKGWFWRMYPPSGFRSGGTCKRTRSGFRSREHPNVSLFRFSFRGNIRQNHPFGSHALGPPEQMLGTMRSQQCRHPLSPRPRLFGLEPNMFRR